MHAAYRDNGVIHGNPYDGATRCYSQFKGGIPFLSFPLKIPKKHDFSKSGGGSRGKTIDVTGSNEAVASYYKIISVLSIDFYFAGKKLFMTLFI